MGFVKEFKEFAVKGNLFDMAVGIIIGGAFGKIVASFVNDILMPPIGFLLGNVDFKDLKYVMKEAVKEGDNIVKEAVTLNYGMFIQNCIDFIIIALSIFMLIKGINAMNRKKKEEDVVAQPTEAPEDIKLLKEIRDELRKRG